MDQLIQLHKKSTLKIIGLMSGTSCDGVDLALIEIKGSGVQTEFKLISSYHLPYSRQQKSGILAMIEQERISLREISQGNFYLAKLWAEAIGNMLKKEKISKDEIDLVGSHGQTFYHYPEDDTFLDRKTSSTLQLGDPAVLAQLTGITTIGDFRVADVALQGQGAPLVPYVDWILFSKLKKNVLVLNIGGIANITHIPADGRKEKVIAFDTGPGNMLIDQLMQRLYELPYDKNGEKAFLGNFSDKLFDYLQKIDFFPKKKPPKSTGREHYGKDFIITLLKRALRRRIPEPDVIHTVSKYTAFTIWQATERFINNKIDTLYVGGGGSHNKFLMKSLSDYFVNTEIRRSGEFGIDEDYKEAICFAILANELIRGNPTNLPGITGATKPAFLGKICLA
ncbi:MAG: anhydro-N-acetylmuramic acid kinase [Calditrichia bacterium]|nr:anhydro-N-acetylmuramic acid kinase [Calditrichia bacterium]